VFVVVVEMPEKRVVVAGSMSQTATLCQETLIKWFANYTMSLKKPASQQGAKSRRVKSRLFWSIVYIVSPWRRWEWHSIKTAVLSSSRHGMVGGLA